MMAVVVAVTVTVTMPVTVAMSVTVRMVVRTAVSGGTGTLRRKAGLFLQFLHAAGVQ